jgi:hypothetical protein
MRTWGYALLILSTVFLVLLGLAEAGGGHVGIAPFLVSAFLMLMGWRLRSAGGGILQRKPATLAGTANAGTAPGQIATLAAAEFSTVEIPLSPEIAALLARQHALTQRALLYVVGGCLVTFVVLGGVLAATDITSGEGHFLLAVLGGIGVASAAILYGISWLTTQRPARKDLRGTTYLRTTGPMSIVAMSGGGILQLADRAFLINKRNGMTELSKLGWGRVDYSPHGHVILGAWDRDGRCVYSLPGYGG